MNKKLIKLILFPVFAAFIFSFFSCENLLSNNAEEKKKNDDSKKAYIVFSLVEQKPKQYSSNNGRTISSIITSSLFSDITFKGVRASDGKVVELNVSSFSELAGKRIEIETGNWTFTLEAYMGKTGGSAGEKYTATQNQEIAYGDNEVQMKLTAEVTDHPEEHPGSWELTVEFPAKSIDQVVISLYDYTAYTSAADLSTLTPKFQMFLTKNTDYFGTGLKSLKIGEAERATGNYIIHVDFCATSNNPDGSIKRESLNSWSEFMRINPAALSSGKITLPVTNEVYKIDYIDAHWDTSYNGDVIVNYTKDSGVLEGVTRYIYLPPATAMYRAGYEFLGWYKDPEFNETADARFPVSDYEDKKFYAKWRELVINIYISATGNDSDDGSKDHPLQTIQAAYSKFDMAYAVDPQGKPVSTIHILSDYVKENATGLTAFTSGQGTIADVKINIVGEKNGVTGAPVTITANLPVDQSLLYLTNSQIYDIKNVNIKSDRELSATDDYNGGCFYVNSGTKLRLENSSIQNYYSKDCLIQIEGECCFKNVQITNNYLVCSDPSAPWGPAVYVKTGWLHLEGKAVIKSNTTLDTTNNEMNVPSNLWIGDFDGSNHYNNAIKIDDNISGSDIHVYMSFEGIAIPTLSQPIAFTDGYFKYNSANASNYFTCDDVYTVIGGMGSEAQFQGDKDGYKLTYVIVQGGEEILTLSDTQVSVLGLPAEHNINEGTTIQAESFTDDDGDSPASVPLAGIYFDSGLSSPLTKTGTEYKIPASQITSPSTLYLKLTVDHVYVDPSVTSTGNLAFMASSPAKTVEEAKKWLKGASGSNNILYVKLSLKKADDINNLTGISKSSSSGGQYGAAIVKRHSSLTNKPVIDLSGGTGTVSVTDVVFDGGVDWGSISDTESVYNKTYTGVESSVCLFGIAGTTNVTLENVTIRNNCIKSSVSADMGALNIEGSANVTLKNCTVTRCYAMGASAICVKNNAVLNMTGGSISYNGSINEASVLLNGNSHYGNSYSFENVSFITNESYQGSGALRVAKNTLVNACTFNGNKSYDSKGSDIYLNGGSSTLTLKGVCSFINGDIYFEAPAAPIILDSTFALAAGNPAVTLTPEKYYSTSGGVTTYNQQVLDFASNSLTTDQINAAKACFKLPASAMDYKIDDNGIIQLDTSGLSISPGVPGYYSCEYILTNNGSDKVITIVIKDGEGDPVDTSLIDASTFKVSLMSNGSLLTTMTGASAYSFTYPKFIDDPTDYTFYVEFAVKPDSTSTVAYSYDFYAKRAWVGSKAPGTSFAVGDVVFTDGSAEAYTSTFTDLQKANAAAIIFYAGDDTSLGSKVLGLAFDVQKSALMNVSLSSFTFDTYDGKKSLAEVKANADWATNASSNFPGFYLAENYSVIINGTTGWYIPAIYELNKIKAIKSTIATACENLGKENILQVYESGTNQRTYFSVTKQDATGLKALRMTEGSILYSATPSSASWICLIREF